MNRRRKCYEWKRGRKWNLLNLMSDILRMRNEAVVLILLLKYNCFSKHFGRRKMQKRKYISRIRMFYEKNEQPFKNLMNDIYF